MSNEIRLAFAHPGERAEAEGGALRDRISLRDYVAEVEIGAFQAERGTTQRIRFNVVVEVLPAGEIADDVDKILSYDRVTEAIEAELSEERLNLLETLAERVADRILAEPQATRCFVRIEKLDRGPGALGVEIVRATDGKSVAPNADVVRPRIVVLSNQAIEHPGLPDWLDRQAGVPLILCVGAADVTPPQAHHKMAQRRIDLLALEQNAWVLAGRDDRCVVVDSRTELDWAMNHGQICVWAPSKIVLDAVDGPSASPTDWLALVAWFAEYMEAEELVGLGVEPPQTSVRTRQENL